jgi:hypothetical protein
MAYAPEVNAQRNNITSALMNIGNPPPSMGPPQFPQGPAPIPQQGLPMQPPFSPPGMPQGGQPLPNVAAAPLPIPPVQPMQQQRPGAGASPGLPPMGGVPQQQY